MLPDLPHLSSPARRVDAHVVSPARELLGVRPVGAVEVDAALENEIID